MSRKIRIRNTNKVVELLETEFNRIGIKYDSKKLGLNYPFENNGLDKECVLTHLVLDLKNKRILTEKETYSVSPTGYKLGTISNKTYVTNGVDTDKFLDMILPFLVQYGINGVADDMGISKRIFKDNGDLDEELVTTEE